MDNLRLLLSAIAVVLLAVVSSPSLHKFLPLNQLSLRGGEVADLVVVNGTIYTSDAAFPFADSMAIRGGRILRVGNSSSMQAEKVYLGRLSLLVYLDRDLAGTGTRTLNLQGKLVVPGFIDSHVHLIYGGLQMAQVQLHGVNQKDQFVNKVKEALSYLEPGTWLQGGGWNNDLWGGEPPLASWIDDITPHNPVWLMRMDGHMGLANSLALDIAGISKTTVDPEGGTIMRNSIGEPTGLLIDSAMKLVMSCIPEVSVEERREALLRAANYALSVVIRALSSWCIKVGHTNCGRNFSGFIDIRYILSSN
ncbi:UNVERIFIED_CONTAM: protein LONG AFTER FAR-RED 3 [Sesamum angustifolium]|uniref:Protein LONG AFTER FAR-RED 3 n=1 Tax=Sesamum angustifolium TaxID=2727405 RepID=A0AAW2P3Z6_9LAMI